jgi:hypothetical protein
MNESCLVLTYKPKVHVLCMWNLPTHFTVQENACDQHAHDSAQTQLRTVSFIAGQGNEKVRFHQLNQIINRSANFIHTTQEHDPQHGHVSWLIHPGPQVSCLDSRCQGRRRGVLQRVNELFQLIRTDIRVPRRVALHRINGLFQHVFNHTFHPLGRCCHNRSGVTGRSRIGRLIDRDDNRLLFTHTLSPLPLGADTVLSRKLYPHESQATFPLQPLYSESVTNTVRKDRSVPLTI